MRNLTFFDYFKPPYAAVLVPCGHSEDGKLGRVYQHAGVLLARAGFVGLVFDPVDQGERKQRPARRNCGVGHNAMGALAMLLGESGLRVRLWDAMRMLDYLSERPDVDAARLGVMGNSGGGTATFYAGAVDTRISMSLPASSYCCYSPSIGDIVHCECNYIPGLMTLGDMGDIAGLTAPRCFCAIQGVKDDIFPIQGARDAFSVTKKVYEAAGVPQNCELYEGPEGHRYYKAGAWQFIEKHLIK